MPPPWRALQPAVAAINRFQRAHIGLDRLALAGAPAAAEVAVGVQPSRDLRRASNRVWLLLPQALLDVHASRAERICVAVALLIASALISGTAPAWIGSREATYLLVDSALFWGALALHLWLVADVWRTAGGRRAP